MTKRFNSMPEINAPNPLGKPQTIFIHKLYDMLHDDDINHLIWWSSSHDSFFVRPTEEFSKVLSWYFKHTNIASFIRQLNMYGFHKVNDETDRDRERDDDGDKEKPTVTWEFKHSNNQFRKGDIESLKLIKRRSSRNVNKEIVFDNLTPTSKPLVHPNTPLNPSPQHAFATQRASFPSHHQILPQPLPIPPQPPPLNHPSSYGSPGYFTCTHNGPERFSITSLDDISMYHNNVISHQYHLQNNMPMDKYLELLNNFNNLKFDFSNLLNRFDYFLNDYKVQQKNLIQLIEILQSNDPNDLNGFKHFLLNNLANSTTPNHASHDPHYQPITQLQPNGIQHYPLNPHYSLRASNHNNNSISVGPTTANNTPNPNDKGREKPDSVLKNKEEFDNQTHPRPHSVQSHSAPSTVPLIKADNSPALVADATNTTVSSANVHNGTKYNALHTVNESTLNGAGSSRAGTHNDGSKKLGRSATVGLGVVQPNSPHAIGFYSSFTRGSKPYSPLSKDRSFHSPVVDPTTPRTSFDSNFTMPSGNVSSNTVPTASSVTMAPTSNIDRKVLPSVSELDRSIKFGKRKRKLSDSRLEDIKKSRN